MSDTLDTLENITYDELNEGDTATFTRIVPPDDPVFHWPDRAAAARAPCVTVIVI